MHFANYFYRWGIGHGAFGKTFSVKKSTLKMEPKNDNSILSKIDWKDLLDSLEDQKCVLFIGNGVYQDPSGNDIESALCNWLDATNPDHPEIRVYNPDGFFLFRKNRYRRKVIANIKEFYSRSFAETETCFTSIAQIPFNMIFTLCYDNTLVRTFDQIGLEYQSDFYFKHRKPSETFERPTRNRPLVYNLMGNIEEPESIILTHGDFFDYMESMFRSNSMHNGLKDELEKAERYIFLGLPYEKWYFQMLLRVLSFHSDKLKEVERTALLEFENPLLHEAYKEEFKIEFIPTNTNEFINELYKRCESNNLLKPLPYDKGQSNNVAAIVSIKETRELVANAEVLEALFNLKAYLNQKAIYGKISTDLLILRNRFNLLKQREMKGTIYQNDFNIEWNQIVETLLSLIAQAEEL